MTPTPEQLAAAHAAYGPLTLRAYDPLVLGISNSLIWKVPTRRLLQLYDKWVSGHHLDVGVGTGYYLDKCHFPTDEPRITLFDSNQDCLTHAARRLARFAPHLRIGSILEPIEPDGEPYRSVSINYVFHCLPGTWAEKSEVFDHLRAVVANGAPVFGSSLLGDGVKHSWLARRLMGYYNRRAIFSNTTDSLAGLHRVLQDNCNEYSLETIGSAALFVVRL